MVEKKYSYTTSIMMRSSKIIKEKIKSVCMKIKFVLLVQVVLCPQKDGSPFGSCMTSTLNAVTIQDSGMPPILEFYTDNVSIEVLIRVLIIHGL